MLFTSCEKELDFKYHEIPPIPVAEIFLTQEGAYAKLTHTTPMGEKLDTVPQVDGNITLTDITFNLSYVLTPGDDGVYRSDVAGIPGHEYRVEIERNGSIVTAKGVMAPEVPIVEMTFSSYKMPYGDSGLLLTKFVDTTPEIGTCYWLRFMRNGKMWRWTTATDHGAREGIVSSIVTLGKIEEEPEDEEDLRDGDVVTVLVTQISRYFYDYLIAVSNDSNGPQMFEGSETLGFFLPAWCTTASATFRLADVLP